MMKFNPNRLKLARKRACLSKIGLARKANVEEKTIRRFENEGHVPSSETLSLLAGILCFPEEFFYGGDLDELSTEGASFRSLKAMLARERDSALAAGAIAFHFDDWVAQKFRLPEPFIPEFKEDIDPESAAQHLRGKWSIGDRPIKNMIHQLEACGIRVFSLCENTKNVDAFSVWRRNIPYIFLNTLKTPERSRFDAAHELGHIVLHRHGGAAHGGSDSEAQANCFASAFLMPRADILAKLPRVTSLNQIVQAKKMWGVSVSALNRRLHSLNITTDWQYRTFNIQISQNHGSEPNPMQRERSAVWEAVLADLRSRGITKMEISQQLNIPVREIESLVFGLSNYQSIEGAGPVGGKGRANLKLV